MAGRRFQVTMRAAGTGPMGAAHSGCAPAEGFQVAAETRAFLAEQGVDLSGEQQTKTKTALEYFSQNLTAAATS